MNKLGLVCCGILLVGVSAPQTDARIVSSTLKINWQTSSDDVGVNDRSYPSVGNLRTPPNLDLPWVTCENCSDSRVQVITTTYRISPWPTILSWFLFLEKRGASLLARPYLNSTQ